MPSTAQSDCEVYGATICVLHVLPVASPVPAVPYGPEGPGPFGFQTVDRNTALAEILRFLATDPNIGVPIDYHVVDAPSVHKEILAQANLLSADVVVVASHGRSGFDRLMLGSVAEKLLRSSPIPIMTVPAHVPDAVPISRDPFRSILYATDFSTGSGAALPVRRVPGAARGGSIDGHARRGADSDWLRPDGRRVVRYPGLSHRARKPGPRQTSHGDPGVGATRL